MAIKRRRITLTAVAGSATGTLGLGASYGRVFRIETVATGADTSSDLAITDADSRSIFALAGTDYVNSGNGVKSDVTPENAKTEDGTAATANAGFGGILAKSPLTVALANAGTNVQVVDVFVEV